MSFSKRISIIAATTILLSFSANAADFKAKLSGGWDGRKVPSGQHCRLFGGKGKTPPMKVTGLPAGTEWLYVEYNDASYGPLSKNGGHGIIGYPVKGTSASLKAVPGMTASLPGGAKVVKRARSSGKYASAGYLPPCSGGRGNKYFADVKAIGKGGKTLAKTRVELGKY